MVNVCAPIATTIMPKQVNNNCISHEQTVELIEPNLVDLFIYSTHRWKIHIRTMLECDIGNRFHNAGDSIVGTTGAAGICANAETYPWGTQRKWTKNNRYYCSNRIARTNEKATQTGVCAAIKAPSGQCIARANIRSIGNFKSQRWIRTSERVKRNGWFDGHCKRIDIHQWNNTKP